METERKLALEGGYSELTSDQDMAYGIVDKQNFVHNNMVPFFKRGIGKGYAPNSEMERRLDNLKQRKVDTFTGSINNPEYKPKTERRPLFNPHVGLTWIYGTPNFTNYMESRFIPGRERRNEKVHQEVRITPGLNLGYNEVSRQGFHDTFRALPKTVDELRAATNPKITYGRPIVPGRKGEYRPIIPNVAKRRPVKFRENDPRDFVKSLAADIRAPTIYGNFDAPDTNRNMTTRAYYGHAQYEQPQLKPGSMYEKVKISHKENFMSPTPRNITGVDQEKNVTNTANTYYAPPTMRQTTQNTSQLNPSVLHQGMKGGYQANHSGTHAPPTLRQLTQNKTQNNPAILHQGMKGGYHSQQCGTIVPPTLRQLTQNKTQNNPAILHQGMKGGYVAQQSGTIAPPTLRQLTQKVTQLNPSVLHQGQKGGYQAAQAGTIAPPTLRQLTQNTSQLNPSILHEGQKGGYQANHAGTHAPPTLRQLTQNKTQNNPAILHQGMKGGYHAEQSGTRAPPTLRQLTQNKTQNNPAILHEGQKGGYHAEQSGTRAPPTLRQLTQNKTQNNPAILHEGQKGGYHAEQSGTRAPPTLRQLTQKTSQLNPTVHHEKLVGGYHAEQSGTRAPPTLRQLTQNKTHNNPAILHEGQKTRARGDINNSLVNIAKEESVIIRDEGAPTTSNYTKIPIYEHVNVELCEPIQINRDVYGNMEGQRPLQCVPTMHTRVANQFPQWSAIRLDPQNVTDNLRNNFLVNNLVHKATYY
jgi:hypothetical protein